MPQVSRAALQRNLAALRTFRGAAEFLRKLPTDMAEFYANGGPGVGEPVVADRFKGEGNSRFAPLSQKYAAWKAGNAKRLNTAQRKKYGRGSKLIDVEFTSKTGQLTGFGRGKNLPILVLSGATRAAVTSRVHRVEQQGDTAFVTFAGLPGYAIYLHQGTGSAPKRSPVEPNEDDIERISEFANRRISAMVGRINQGPVAFGGGQARIIS